MADPICRWRNPYLGTVMELINILPKGEMTQNTARQKVIYRSPYDFYRTPYQLASQLGLYYEENERYFPKFTYIPSDEEVKEYMKNWIIRYCIPNPYTQGFKELEPFSIHAKICGLLSQSGAPINWDATRVNIFGGEIGNKDILRNSLSSHSPVIEIEGGYVRLRDGKNYEDLLPYIDVDVSSDRNNKEYFFDLFPIPNNLGTNNQEVIQEVSRQEIELVNEVQSLLDLTQTEKNQIVAARIGQGLFRRSLILECGYCPITLVDDAGILIASHIKPWKKSNNTERINPKNGILLTPTYDKLFDKGIISFTNNKELLVSSTISEDNKQRLNLVRERVFPALPVEGREEFLDYHRNRIFID